MTKDQATKRPWDMKFNTNLTGNGTSNYGYQLRGNNKKESICVDLNESNARLIVKAVNCHDELVEALKMMVKIYADCKEIQAELKSGSLKNVSDEYYIKIAEQKLAKAEIN